MNRMSQSQYVVSDGVLMTCLLLLPCFRIQVSLILVWNQSVVYLKLAGLKFG